MRATAELVFPLIPLRRSRALEVAGRASRHRGTGDEIASSRAYRRGDAIRSVDWAASARLSTARGRDEFVVRDHFAEDVIRVVVVIDRSPSMALFPEGLPWLRKPAAVREAAAMIVASGVVASALIGFAESGSQGLRLDWPARDRTLRAAVVRHALDGEMTGPDDSLDQALSLLLANRSGRLPAGTFVFVVSDYLPTSSLPLLRAAVETGWDLIPVVVQDPVWERSFPDISGVTVPLSAADGGGAALVRLSRKEARARRDANEIRTLELDAAFREIGLDAVSVATSDRSAIHSAFLAWAARRGTRLRRHR
jgi:uncharacterized protein (DUF58 family)